MPQLVSPTVAVMQSFLGAMDEAWREGADNTQTAGWIARYGATWHTLEGFADFVAQLHAEESDPSVLPHGWVLTSTRWWVEGDEYLGRIAVRHVLSDFLREVGGHIGYDVRPSARRRGHATAMLRAVLPYAHELGIDPALVTCDDDNVPSIRVIEACGGVLEDVRGRKRRYWVPTSA
ncbi:GNAT family N-acetyltransferase [Nocardioides gansuensis]|uniref:GNAT family N-acetyltransferase n=1 Tax=Nocardioides gansuensis TaxID=2138300 RepID=A0A2T8FCK0_9ACTN|nr:GNAT family N-acetyltransferase [Nocardioides gansuensis]PVG83430.1 GNAT family N-acetyltransferase [Nocardioides gansuensis]